MEAKRLAPRRSGQRSTPMAMISNMAARHVCFTKRRRGLFKKVCELSTLCGTDSLAFVTSNAGKLYSIGTPDVPAAVDRFLHMLQHPGDDGGAGGAAAGGEQPPPPPATSSGEVDGPGCGRQLLEKLLEEIDALERVLDELRKLRALLRRSTEEKAGRLPRQWVEVIGKLPTHELEEMMASLQELQAKALGFGAAPEQMAAPEAAARNHPILDSTSSAPCGEAVRDNTAGAGGHADVVLPAAVKYGSSSIPNVPGVLLPPCGGLHDADRSRLAAAAAASAVYRNLQLLGQAADPYRSSTANPPTSLLPPPYAPSWGRPSSMIYPGATAVVFAPPSTVMMPVDAVNLLPVLRRFPSSAGADHNSVMMNPAAHSSSGILIAPANLPAPERPFDLPAAPRTLILNTSSCFARGYSAMQYHYHRPILPSSHSTPFNKISTSTAAAAAAAPPRRTSRGDRVHAARAITGHIYVGPPTAQRVGSHVASPPGETAPMMLNGVVRGEERGMEGSSPSSAPPSCGFFDIPRDFDFGRDWSV